MAKCVCFFSLLIDVKAAFRANTKNAAILEKYLRTKGQASIKSQGAVVPTVDPSDPDEFDRMMATHGPPPGYTADEPSQHPPMRQTAPPQTTQEQTPSGTTDTATTTTTQTSGSGWFSGWGRKTKQPDVESTAGQQHGDTPLSDLPTRPARERKTR